jgi:hypothetical protein
MNNPDGTVNTAGTHTSLGQRDASLGSGRVRSYTHG